MTQAADVPPYQNMLWPTLIAVARAGGSASNGEIVNAVLEQEQYSQEQQEVLHGGGPQTEIGYRLAWARSYLKKMELLTNSSRGIWSLTDQGQRLVSETKDDSLARAKVLGLWSVAKSRRRRATRTISKARELPDAEGPDTSEWKDQLLKALMAMPPDGFERLAQRILREAGFISATVTGRSSDGGIDGLGVYRLSLMSFPVFFQCKRYRGSVGVGAVRDFRGAMAGRGDKGLLITTGTFTAEATAEATRDGAPPIDLIDGDQLCDLLKKYEIGVDVTIRQVEDVVVHDQSFFNDL